MKFSIKHEIDGRLRIHVFQKKMSFEQADILQFYLTQHPFIYTAKVYERTQDAVICYDGSRQDMIHYLQAFSYEKTEVPDGFLENTGRELNAIYFEKLVTKVIRRSTFKYLLPLPIRTVIIIVKSLKYFKKAFLSLCKGKIEVALLDATAIGVSLLRGDRKTAGSIMFMLGIGELLEEWTHKKSVSSLAKSMSLNISKVWMLQEDGEILVPVSHIRPDDKIVVRMGNVIPFDGVVTAGDAMINQASLTGETNPVHKQAEGYVYAGTVVEEGEVTIRVTQTKGSSRYEKIVAMIEETEKLKSQSESKAEHLADRLVPYTLGGTLLTYLLTRNTTKALSVLMVDFSCALKLAMPITVLSAICEAGQHHITVKGGKFLEAVAEADTIVFDKTGTLTKAQPTVVDVISFNDMEPDELLRIAACMEEHFPHSMAKAVAEAAIRKNLEHTEMHSKVEYIVAHGISTTIEGKKAIIGSHHFVFEDEQSTIPEGMQERYDALPEAFSKLYLAIEGVLAAVICIEDPLRNEAAAVIKGLKASGISKVIMMTGDGEKTAHYIADKVGVDEYYSEVLPEDKARYVEQERAEGRKVIMIGDGINDSPALSAADVGIAINEGAEIAREISDITIGEDNLSSLITLKAISDGLLKRIHSNYRKIVSFNTGLIGLGIGGVIQPTTSAFLHNASTLAISVKSMDNILKEK